MATKNELLEKLDECFFKEVHSSWYFVRGTIEKIVEKYNGKWERKCEVEISQEEKRKYCGNSVSITALTEMLKEIDIKAKGISVEGDILKFILPEIGKEGGKMTSKNNSLWKWGQRLLYRRFPSHR